MRARNSSTKGMTEAKGMILVVRGHINIKGPNMKTIYVGRSDSVRQSPSRSAHQARGVTGVEELSAVSATSLINLEKLADALRIPLSELFRSV
jgi:hypothetical protein